MQKEVNFKLLLKDCLLARYHFYSFFFPSVSTIKPILFWQITGNEDLVGKLEKSQITSVNVSD